MTIEAVFDHTPRGKVYKTLGSIRTSLADTGHWLRNNNGLIPIFAKPHALVMSNECIRACLQMDGVSKQLHYVYICAWCFFSFFCIEWINFNIVSLYMKIQISLKSRYSKTCVRQPPLKLTLVVDVERWLSYKGTCHVILLAKLHDMYLYKTDNFFPHQPLFKVSLTQVLLYSKLTHWCQDIFRKEVNRKEHMLF